MRRQLMGFYVLLILVLCCFVVFASCMAPPPLFRVGSNTWLGYEPLYLARDLGHYKQAPIRFIEMPNSSEVLQAFRNGVLEAAALTLDEALSVLQDGYDLQIVLVMDFSQGGDVVMARPPINSPAALRGQRIGVEKTAVGAIMLDAVLHEADLSVSEVQLLPLPLDMHESAYVAGELDAVVTFEPVRSRLLAQGAEIIFDSRQVPGRIVDVLVVSREVLHNEHQKTLKQLLRGYFAALAYLQKQPEKAAKNMSKRLKLPPAQVLQSLQDIHQPSLAENHRLLGEPPQLLDTAQTLQRLMLKQNMLYRHSSLDNMFSAAALPKLP